MDFEEFFNSHGNTSNDETNEGCSDHPNGFQDIDPSFFTLIGAIIGEVMAGNLPFNVQNALGNWLCLVGQSIITFNSQQQYFENGPGRYYERKNRNVTNPFCPSTPSNVSNIGTNGDTGTNGNTGNNSSNTDNGASSNTNLEELCKCVNHLLIEINDLKEEVRELKSNKR